MSTIHVFSAKLEKIPSTNTLYLIGRSKTSAWLYLNPVVDKYKKDLISALRKDLIHDQFSGYTGKEIMNVNIDFIMKENFWARDTDNCIKATLDAFTAASKIDDSRNISVSSKKILNDLDDNEYVLLTIEVKPDDPSIYKWSNMIK